MITAIRIGPSEYALATDRIEQGSEFTANGNTFRVVGKPITVGWHAAEARVREVGGPHDGNEFSAHLHT